MQDKIFSSKKHLTKSTKSKILNNYLGSYYKGNYVWGGAMNLAWNELNDEILHEKLKLATKDKIALEMVSKLNDSPFSKKDLDEESCYIKAGYGQKTVDKINKELREKFPEKSFQDLDLQLDPKDIISYAYLFKKVEYKTQFKKDDVLFNGKKVKGFIADNEAQRENIKIIKYENDDKFIIKLQLKDKNDELILAKGYDMTNPQIVVEEINKNNKEYLSTIDESDRFEAPKLHLNYHRDYVELIGKYLSNRNFTDYLIGKMFENIKFDMNEEGARVENEAVIAVLKTTSFGPKKHKEFILNKPYWVIMKRRNSQNPYFILGVNNSELMEK